MKLGFLTACMPNRSLAAVASWAAEHGFDALEVAAWPDLGDRPFTATHLLVDGFTEGNAEATKELFAIFETTLVRRGEGRVGGASVPGSRSTEFFLEPGLEYVASPRLAFEASLQLPVARSPGPLALRTDRNLLVGMKFLF